jgi:glycosyltransferase involved in cell wall biosynthesis
MPVVAQRVSREMGIPYTVMPHGSDMEYAVKKDPRFLRYAESAFTDAKKVFVIGEEMRERVNTVLSFVPRLNEKCVELHLGVDTSEFLPVSRDQRSDNIAKLNASLSGKKRGRTRAQTEKMYSDLAGTMTQEELRDVFAEASRFNGKAPDEDVEQRLSTIDWANDPILLFVGRIISMKGVQSVFAALPLILEKVSNLKLIVVGHGPLREPMEAFVYALERGDRLLAEKIVWWGRALEGVSDDDASARLDEIGRFLGELEKRGDLKRYFTPQKSNVRATNVIFTGYLTHTELQFLLPSADVGVFPSIVREAGPLVFLEALASGCLPLGTYFGGMAAGIDAVSKGASPEIAEVMKLDPQNTIGDIVKKVPLALEASITSRNDLARFARERYDWKSVATVFQRELESLV